MDTLEKKTKVKELWQLCFHDDERFVNLLFDNLYRDDHKKSKLPTVLIADDTDLPKAGFHMEAIRKIFSHVHHTKQSSI